MAARFKITVITIMLPGQIRKYVEQMAEKGWEIRAVGTNLIFLERIGDTPLEAKMESITLKRPEGIARLLQEQAQEGWDLNALGSNFLFFNRTREPACPLDLEFRIEPIATVVPSQVFTRASELGEEGWDLGGVGSTHMIFKRRRGYTQRRAFLFENITLKTPEGMSKLLQERGKAGWRLSGVGKVYMAFTQESPAG